MYLDNAATTRVTAEVARVAEMSEFFYNASAIYSVGLKNSKRLSSVRELIKKRLGIPFGDVIFTSGATESNNLAIFGSVRSRAEKYVFSAGEHPSVYNAAKRLKELGHEVVFVGLTSEGKVDLKELGRVLDDSVKFLSIMHVSNETGAINDLEEISSLKESKCKEALFHVDGVQAFCKLETDLKNTSVDFYSISGHKFHAPKGVGALYVRNKARLKNINYGGGQEFGLRSGTENVPAIMGMERAILDSSVSDLLKVKEIYSEALQILEEGGGKIFVRGGSPYILSVGFPGVNGETLVHELDSRGIYISRGSACSSRAAGNRVLEAIGFSIGEIVSGVRISFNAIDDSSEVILAMHEIVKAYKELAERVKKVRKGCFRS